MMARSTRRRQRTTQNDSRWDQLKDLVGERAWMVIAPAYLVACLVLGGASAAGALANTLLQLGAIALLVLMVWANRVHIPPEARPLAWIVLAFAALVALTLVPLPFTLWAALPYRAEIAEAFRLMAIPVQSLPVSLAPDATITSALSILPPLAMFLLMAQLPNEGRRRIAAVVIIMALASLALGAFQLLGGAGSPLRFYEITNAGRPVGLFANINHQATLLLCALPCAGYLAARLAARTERSERSGGAIFAVMSLIFLAVGIAATGSMAGYGLFFPAAFGTLLIYRRTIAARITGRWRAGLVVLLVLFVGLALAGPLSQETLGSKFNKSPVSRQVFAATTTEAIAESWPVGTGLGTFADVYRRFEDPARPIVEYTNHAHNDYLEIALELGLLGVLITIAFFLWWLARSRHAWRTDTAGAALARTGSIIIGIILLHSLVDYPLRTSAMAAVFAAACALLVPAPLKTRRSQSESAQPPKPLRHVEAA